MARPLRFASVSLCLGVSTALAMPASASPYVGAGFAGMQAPSEVSVAATTAPEEELNAPSPKVQAKGEIAPGDAPGIRFGTMGLRLKQRVRTYYRAPASGEPTTPFMVAESLTGGAPLVLAITPPGEPLPAPSPRQRRLTPTTVFAVGVATFTASYLASALTAIYVRRHCTDPIEMDCVRHAGTLTVPVAGPFLVATRTHDPRDYALGAVQAAGLFTAVLGAIFMLTDRHQQRALDQQGIRISRHARLRPEAGGLTVHARF